MRPHAVDLGLRYCPHTDLVKGPGEEGGKRGDEHDVPVSTPQTYPHAQHVLLRDETLDEPLRILLHVRDGKGGVFSVPIQSHYTLEGVPQLDQGFTIRLTSGNLYIHGH